MKALVYHGPGRKAWEHVPDPPGVRFAVAPDPRTGLNVRVVDVVLILAGVLGLPPRLARG